LEFALAGLVEHRIRRIPDNCQDIAGAIAEVRTEMIEAARRLVQARHAMAAATDVLKAESRGKDPSAPFVHDCGV
jgi:hypothetical protein